jgi:mannose/fructose/N-acetylgalactosamine-specific phosphotransferase system component IIB
VHGQVAFTWVSSLNIDCLIVANDKVANDEFQKIALGLAKPPRAQLIILSIKKAISYLNYHKSKNLILFKLNSI